MLAAGKAYYLVKQIGRVARGKLFRSRQSTANDQLCVMTSQIGDPANEQRLLLPLMNCFSGDGSIRELACNHVRIDGN